MYKPFIMTIFPVIFVLKKPYLIGRIIDGGTSKFHFCPAIRYKFVFTKCVIAKLYETLMGKYCRAFQRNSDSFRRRRINTRTKYKIAALSEIGVELQASNVITVPIGNFRSYCSLFRQIINWRRRISHANFPIHSTTVSKKALYSSL